MEANSASILASCLEAQAPGWKLKTCSELESYLMSLMSSCSCRPHLATHLGKILVLAIGCNRVIEVVFTCIHPIDPLSYQAFIAFRTLYAAVISLPPYHNWKEPCNFASSSNWLEALLRRLLRQFDRQSRAMVPLVGPDTIFHCEAVALLQFNSFGQHHGKFI